MLVMVEKSERIEEEITTFIAVVPGSERKPYKWKHSTFASRRLGKILAAWEGEWLEKGPIGKNRDTLGGKVS